MKAPMTARGHNNAGSGAQRKKLLVCTVAASAVVALVLLSAAGDASGVAASTTTSGADVRILADGAHAQPAQPQPTSAATPPPTEPYDVSTEVVDPSCPKLVDFYFETPDRCPQTLRITSRWIAHDRVARRERWTLVDVGGNKGYGIASLLDELKLAGRKGLGVERMALALFRFGTDKMGGSTECQHVAGLCGSCCDCASWIEYDPEADKVPQSSALVDADGDGVADELPGHWHMFVFEPTRANSEFLMNFYGDPARVSLASKGKGQVTVYSETAASDVTELGTMPDVPLGIEYMSISKDNKGRMIQKITLDEAIPRVVEYIDVLMTDTEGHDYLVADGAKRFLDAGNVGLYIFELWGKDRSLKAHLERVEKAGMACYVLVRPDQRHARVRTVARIRSDCGSERYFGRFVGWQNAVCVNEAKEPELASVFKELSETRVAPMPKMCEIPHFQPHTVTFATKHADEPWAEQVLQRCRAVRQPVY